MGAFREAVAKVRAINRTYAVPRIRLTMGTKIVLMVLRLYLLALVGLLLYALVAHLGY